MKQWTLFFTVTVLAILAVVLLGCGQKPTETPVIPPAVLKLATTTSTEQTGLLAYLLPFYEKKANVKIHVIAVGSGKAMKLGENGDVDVLLVHAKPDEEIFVAAGFGLYRKDVMYNDFVIVGPAADPAGLKGSPDALEAFRRLTAGKAPFVSRGDDSGTHKKEKALWKEAGLEPKGDWYRESGQGMGEVLQMASSLGGYTLADRGTYLSMKDKLKLDVLTEGDKRLFNQYGVIPVNLKRFNNRDTSPAEAFAAWLVSPEAQELIGKFGFAEYGKPLFIPNAGK